MLNSEEIYVFKSESKWKKKRTSGVDWDCFWVKSSLLFSKVTAPKEPNFPFITGPKSPFGEEFKTGADGAKKQRSNPATESPPPSIVGQEEEEEEEEHLMVWLWLTLFLVPRRWHNWGIGEVGFKVKVVLVVVVGICVVWNTKWDIFKLLWRTKDNFFRVLFI